MIYYFHYLDNNSNSYLETDSNMHLRLLSIIAALAIQECPATAHANITVNKSKKEKPTKWAKKSNQEN